MATVAQDQDTLAGTIEKVVFGKEGFLIARTTDGNTVKGSMANPLLCVEYTFTGRWVNDPKYGKQFFFSGFTANLPREGNAIAKYLTENAKWVGPSVAQAIIEAYGQNSLDILKSDPERAAAEVRGLNLTRALEVSAMLRANEAEERMAIALNELLMGTGISRSATNRIVKTWGSNSPDMIRENPFCLTQITGIGFLMADKVRVRLGIPTNDPDRIRAGIVFTLEESAWGGGHTYLPDNVSLHGDGRNIAGACTILRVAESEVMAQVAMMSEAGDLSLS